MFEFGQYLECENYQRINAGGRVAYKAAISGQAIFAINKTVPMIVRGKGCVGIAIPYEIHISADNTIVFFTIVDPRSYNPKLLRNLYSMYVIQNGDGMSRPVDQDTRSSGMDAATRMAMGIERSARDIANGRDMIRPDEDYDGPSVFDLMRETDKDDHFFDD